MLLAFGIALVGGSFIGAKFFGKTAGSIKDTPIEKVNDLKKEEGDKLKTADDKVNKETTNQLDTAQALVHATSTAIDAAKEKNSAGIPPTRELETAKEINDLAITSIDAGLNKSVDPKLLKWFIDAIDKKNSEIERERKLGEQMIASKEKEIIASTEREMKAVAERIRIEEEYKTKLADANEKVTEWALENSVKAQKLDNIYFWIYIVIGLWVASMVMPIISKVFPAVAPAANVLGGIVAPGVQFLKHKAETLSEDLVALNTANKKFVESIDPSKVEAFKEHVAAWWEKDTASQDAVERIKKKLRQ